MSKFKRTGAFVLIDILLGVAIFTGGIIALGMAVGNCLDGQEALAAADRARLALDNRLSEMLAGAVAPEAESRMALEDAFEGIVLSQTAAPLEAENEEGIVISGIQVVTLTAEWMTAGEPQRQDVTFYVSTPR